MPGLWPGGIPSHIRPHHTADLSFDEIKEEVKGWLLFESWVSRAHAGVAESEDEDYELRQRRALVDRWAAATQEFRDSFQERAPIGLPGTETKNFPSDPDEGLRYPPEALERMFNPSQPGHNGGVISLAPVDVAHPVNQARWVKFLILLYRYDFGSGHCLDNDYTFSVASLNPATTTTASFDDFVPWLFLESALFSDEEGLRTGRLAIVDYDINGTVKDLVLRRPFNMHQPYQNLFHNGQSISDVSQGLGGGNFHNQPTKSLEASIFRVHSDNGIKAVLAPEYANEIRAHDIYEFEPFSQLASSDGIFQDAIRMKLTQNLDPKPLPLVERTNSLPIEQFTSLYIDPELLDYHLLWCPKGKYNQHDGDKPHIKVHCTVDVYSSSTIPKEEFDVCFNLVEQTSADAYRASSSGWSAARKRKEMRLPDMKYLIHRRSRSGSPEVTIADGISFQRGEILAFLSFMVTYEDGKEVIYCYEVHVAPKAQRLGIGMHLMMLLRSIGLKIGLEKAMLTCFRSNHRALRFYKSIGYKVDENSPRSIRLRTGEVEPDYYIMSESLKQKVDTRE
ncbi:hypothetical protein CNMCM5623_009612 [Aspergillus felis]|uniref:N-alpha-acetyltransferase 40 n=1 Tax=Aspergillus felis TaxID=1287682 RepID=A0A8H6UTM3_9EURO|nr:hypothetical protein CNMCM5623_009612 [Aspergillus felis]